MAPSSLPNHRDTARNGRLMQLAGMEAGLVQVPHEIRRLSSPSKHVQQQCSISFRRR